MVRELWQQVWILLMIKAVPDHVEQVVHFGYVLIFYQENSTVHCVIVTTFVPLLIEDSGAIMTVSPAFSPAVTSA